METTKQKILRASLELFSTKGYKATTTKEIAKTCSLHESTIFRNFSSKKEIFETLLEEHMQLFSLTELYENEMTDNLHTSLHILLNKYKELNKKYYKIYLILFRNALSGEYLNYVNKTIGKHATSLLTNYFEKISDKYHFKGTPEELTHFCLSLINGMHMRKSALHLDDNTISDDRLIEILLTGILKEEKGTAK